MPNFPFPVVRSAALVFAAGLLAACGGSHDAPVPDQPVGGAPSSAGAAGVAATAPGPVDDHVVATVNGREIRARQVDELAAVNRMRLQAAGQTLDDAAEKNLRAAALSLIIDGELLIEEAKKEGLAVPPDEVAAEVQRLQDQYGTPAAFAEVLEQQGMTEDGFHKEIERRLLMQKYVETIAGNPKAEEAEVRELYDAHPDAFTEGEKVRVSYILVPSSPEDPQARRDDARRRIEEAHAKAVAGEDFAALAKQYSQDPTAAKGGDVGFFPRGVMFPEFEKQAFSLEIGKISPVFETPKGFNVLEVTGRKPPTKIPFAEVKPTLTLQVVQQKESAAVKARLQQLREAAKIDLVDHSFLPDEAGGDAKPAAPKEG